jgi:cytochrome c556
MAIAARRQQSLVDILSIPPAVHRPLAPGQSLEVEGSSMNIRKTVSISAAMLALSVALAFAHGRATGIVKERMDAMEEISASMKQVGQMLRGQKPFDALEIGAAAGIIAGHSGDNLTRQFPPESLMPPTEASPVIWEKWEQFSGMANDMETAAMSITDAVQSGADRDQIATAFGRLAQTCKTCHEAFRVKK